MSSAATALSEGTRLYHIGEVSCIADLKPLVLRYWESEFRMLQPEKSPLGHRLYRQEDVDLVLKIKRLLYDEGFTIAGARRQLLDLDPEAAADQAGGANHGSLAAEHPATHLSRKLLLDLRDSLR